jgi:hypothetical protein
MVATHVRRPVLGGMRDWLLQAGFATVDGYGQDGASLSPASRRLLVVARR